MSLDGPILDTNVVLRLLRKEDAQHEAAKRLLEETTAHNRRMVLLDMALAEVVFVLSSFYKYSRLEVAEAVTALLNHRGVGVAHPEVVLDALVRYTGSNLHFVDCYLAAMAKAAGREICTFDEGLARFGDVRIIGPGGASAG